MLQALLRPASAVRRLRHPPFSSTASSEQCTMVERRAESSSPPKVDRYSGEFCVGDRNSESMQVKYRVAGAACVPELAGKGRQHDGGPDCGCRVEAEQHVPHIGCDDGCRNYHGACRLGLNRRGRQAAAAAAAAAAQVAGRQSAAVC